MQFERFLFQIDRFSYEIADIAEMNFFKNKARGRTWSGPMTEKNAVIGNFHPAAFLVAATPPGQKKNHLSISARSCEKGSNLLQRSDNFPLVKEVLIPCSIRDEIECDKDIFFGLFWVLGTGR